MVGAVALDAWLLVDVVDLVDVALELVCEDACDEEFLRCGVDLSAEPLPEEERDEEPVASELGALPLADLLVVAVTASDPDPVAPELLSLLPPPEPPEPPPTTPPPRIVCSPEPGPA